MEKHRDDNFLNQKTSILSRQEMILKSEQIQDDSHEDNEGNFESFQAKSILFGEGKEIKDALICFLCSCLIVNPCICDHCQQTYCKKCIDKWQKEGAGCIKCNGKKFIRKTPPMFDDFLKIIRVNCPFSINQPPLPSCSFVKMEWKEVQEHYKICKFKIVKCKNKECSFEGMKEQLDDHQANCEYNKERCTQCNKLIYKVLTFQHLEKCPESYSYCSICNQKMQIKYLADHLLECPQKIIECQCGNQIINQNKQMHLQECPMQMVECPSCMQFHNRQDINKNKVCIKELSNKCKKIERSVENLKKDIQELKQLYEMQQQRQ